MFLFYPKQMAAISWEQWRQEPYRCLFPLGLMLVTLGMGVWIPYYFFPLSIPHPGQAHATLQIQGFLLCFIFGFLGTMLPKVLGVLPLGKWQFLFFPVSITGISLAALIGAPMIGQALHLLLLIHFVFFIGRRWPMRRGNPPSSFSFIALAMLSDAIGSVLRLLAYAGIGGYQQARMGALFQYQAFPLLLILGVGSFLLPKLFGNAEINPEALRSQSGKSPLTFLPWGLLFILSFAIDAWIIQPMAIRATAALRAGIWIWFLFCSVRIQGISTTLPGYLAGARLSLWAIGIGLAMPIVLPAYTLAWEHMVFITGMMWLTLSIAARVTSAHGGHLEVLQGHRKKTLGYGWLFFLAMASRVSTDIWTAGHWLLMAVAATLAIAAIVLWATIYLPLIFELPGRPKV